jgi:phosphoribosyl-ATP pyrophosphohydrolase
VSRSRVLKRRPALPAGGAGFASRGRAPATLRPQSVNTLLWVGGIVIGMSDSLDRLYAAVLAARTADPATSRTARLLRSGRSKMAKKLAEEAVEVVIDAMHGHSDAVVRESADLLYNLVVLWVASGVHPKDVWLEMTRRERLLGIAEKLPKERADASPRRKVVTLDRSRARKRR